MKKSGSNKKKIANNLVALSSAAVLAVYSAGYARTRSAADQFETQAAARRQAARASRPASSVTELRRTAPYLPAGRSGLPAAAANPARDTGGKPGMIASLEPAQAMSNFSGSAPSPAETPAAFSPSPSSSPSSPAAPATAAVVNQAVEPAAPAIEHKIEAAVNVPVVPAGTPAWGKDGTYYGWGTSRHGDIQAEVVIRGGRIASATIVECLTKYSCSVIDKLPPRVIQKQTPEVSFITTATESSNAFYFAVLDAIDKAQ